ncbi:MAG: leukotoxin LktA family filamentous adhesin, partial [Rhodanobacter sp.]
MGTKSFPLQPSAARFDAGHAMPRFTIKSLAAAITAVLGVAMSMQAAAVVTNINKDGKTDTTVAHATSSHLYDVTTTTLSQNGNTAFNSFHDFTVDASDTVNMHLPDSSKNLVNLVWDSQTVINGTLNSLVGSGVNAKVGGNVYFADPHGVVVGATGVLNVGALSLSAPSSEFMGSLLDSGSLKTNTASGQPMYVLLTGQEAQAKAGANTCLICINGTINANNAVRIRATAIDVSGTIYVAGKGDDSLSTA